MALAAPPTLTTLPLELHLELFEYLDICSSVCLDLTCKKLWAIHSQDYKVFPISSTSFGACPLWPLKVGLTSAVQDINGKEHKLGELLKQWMSPNYWLPFAGNIFWPTWQKLRQLELQREKERIGTEARERKAKIALDNREQKILQGQRSFLGAVWVERHRPSSSLREGARA